jgi:Uma2 family endonuclease
MDTQPKKFLTPEEYLVQERLAETKSEYYCGEVFPMAPSNMNHSLIVTNLVGSLGTSLRRSECRVYCSNLRLLVCETGFYTYPDVLVVRGKPIPTDANSDVLTNPVLLIEVFSESTENHDRGFKLHQYMRIPSLQEYLTVSQTEMLIDHHIRQPDNSWLIRELTPANGKVPIHCFGVELDFADVYQRIEFNEATAS